MDKRRKIVMLDIYFEAQYGKLYEKMENGNVEIFEYEDENGKISNQFIKRKIPTIEEYYDITTPYRIWRSDY